MNTNNLLKLMTSFNKLKCVYTENKIETPPHTNYTHKTEGRVRKPKQFGSPNVRVELQI